MGDIFVTDTVFLSALCAVTVLSLTVIFLSSHRVRKVLLPSLLVAGTGAVSAVILIESVRSYALTVGASLVNAFLERLHGVQYLTLVPLLPYGDAALSQEHRIRAAAVLLTVSVALLFVPFLIKRVRMIVPTAVSAAVLIFVFTCNLTHSNWSFSVMVAAFAALIVMGAYDKRYRRRDRRGGYDTTAVLFPESDRPTLPEEISDRKRQKAERKQKKAESRKLAREKALKRLKEKKERPQVSVEEELSMYFRTDEERKETAVRLTPEEKKRARDERKRSRTERKNADRLKRREARQHSRALRNGVDAVHEYDRKTEDSRAAAGGFAALTAFLLMLLVLWLPAAAVERGIQTIPALEEHLKYYREYFTALLVGNEDILDALDYEKTGDLDPHTASLENRYYDGSAVFYVRTHAAANVYFKGWTATDFYADHWYSVSDEQLDRYRELYGLQDYPAEELKTDFYRYFLSDTLPDVLDEEIDWSTDYGYVPRYGVVLEEISVRRLSDTLDSKVFLPSSYVADYGMREYGETKKIGLNFIHYYDGIAVGRDFRETENAEYSVLAYVSTMRNPNFMQNLSETLETYNVNKTLCLLYDTGYFTDPAVNPAIDRITGYDGTGYSGYYAPLGVNVISYFDGRGVLRESRIILMDQSMDVSLFQSYISEMTAKEKSALRKSFLSHETYRDYVYDTYLSTAVHVTEAGYREESAILSALSDAIAEEYKTLLTDAIGAEVLSDAAYRARHAFICAVIAYMKENCRYIERDPDTMDLVIDFESLEADESLNSIENFLTVTKQGYCVQFASSLCLLLREQGIPARYVEGYVLDDQVRDRNHREIVYNGFVRDYNAHAWVEVWYDGIGWIPYEATPGEYYYDMYPDDEASPGTPPDTDDTDDTDEPPEEDPEYDTEHDSGMTEEEREAIEEAERREKRFRMIVTLAILGLILLALTAVVLILVIGAARKERMRDRRIERILKGAYPPEQRREEALGLIDAVSELLLLYGLAPMTGEQRMVYADRLRETAPSVFGLVPRTPQIGNTATEETRKARKAVESLAPLFPTEIDARALFLSIAAEEFGGGMSVEEMKTLAEFYRRLRTQKKRFVRPIRRFVLHYFGRKL
jgi:transglutaminase-like putative cysteine protease